METYIKIMIVEDDADFVWLIRKFLERQEAFRVVDTCTNGFEAVGKACACQPDIVLVDLNLGYSAMDGVEVARQIRIRTDAKILILTASEEPDIILKAAREAFASGYIFKSQPNILAETILSLSHGYTAQKYLIASAALSCLSEAEMAVFQMLMGKSVSLQSSSKTIANQKTAILKKLGLANQKELMHVFRMFRL